MLRAIIDSPQGLRERSDRLSFELVRPDPSASLICIARNRERVVAIEQHRITRKRFDQRSFNRSTAGALRSRSKSIGPENNYGIVTRTTRNKKKREHAFGNVFSSVHGVRLFCQAYNSRKQKVTRRKNYVLLFFFFFGRS